MDMHRSSLKADPGFELRKKRMEEDQDTLQNLSRSYFKQISGGWEVVVDLRPGDALWTGY